MAKLVVLAWSLYLAIAVGFRAWLQLRMTGSTGIVLPRRGAPLLDRIASVMVVAATLLGVAAAVVAWLASPRPPSWFAVPEVTPLWKAAGLALYVGGVGATLGAQLAMGRSWRMGVEQSARTDLVVHGPFRWVRNPIYSAMLLTQAGLTALLPSPAACLALALLFVALELQVRLIEEPYLARVHGDAYRAYAARTGRFIPGIGRNAPGMS